MISGDLGSLRTFKLVIAYDGTNYAGWQRQLGVDTIQARLEAAVAEIEGSHVTVHGAGRTDSGVHALGQVASFEIEHGITASALRRALNAKLPEDIRVQDVGTVSRLFHARFKARRKLYQYRINCATVANPMECRFAWHIGDALDLSVMRQAAVALIGQHDFASFQTAATAAEVTTTVRTIFSIEIRVKPDGIVTIDVVGDGFLRYMVRTIVGTLVEVGLGRREANDMPGVLLAKSRDLAGPTAPAMGLCLVAVDYSGT